jgi:hypothetical protein
MPSTLPMTAWRTNHSTQVVALGRSGGASVGLWARIVWKWMFKQELFKQAPQNQLDFAAIRAKSEANGWPITVDFKEKGNYCSYT